MILTTLNPAKQSAPSRTAECLLLALLISVNYLEPKVFVSLCFGYPIIQVISSFSVNLYIDFSLDFLVLPQHVDKTHDKHGVIRGVADKSTFVVDVWCSSYFKAKPHSPSKHSDVS